MQDKQSPEKTVYQSYVLRLWQDNINARWRLSIRKSGEETPHVFTSIHALSTFLTQQVNEIEAEAFTLNSQIASSTGSSK